MGYFAYAYVVTAEDHGDKIIETVEGYRADSDGHAFFSWAPGKRSGGTPLADGTLVAGAHLRQLPTYPRTEETASRRDAPELFFMEHSFTGKSEAPVLFHFLLPPRFIPRANREPLVQPSLASVVERKDRLSVTYACRGGGDVRFWIARLSPNEKFADFDLTQILTPKVQKRGFKGGAIEIGGGLWPAKLKLEF